MENVKEKSMLDQCEWKEHPCGLCVSVHGEVFVPKTKGHYEHYTYGSKNSNGYLQVVYKGKKYKVHRLIAETFIPNPQCKPEVDHINMVKSDNRVDNLRWATRNEQMTFDDQTIAKKVLQLTLDGELVREWSSICECGRNGYKQGNVCKCCNNKFNREGNNVYKGYKWQYSTA